MAAFQAARAGAAPAWRTNFNASLVKQISHDFAKVGFHVRFVDEAPFFALLVQKQNIGFVNRERRSVTGTWLHCMLIVM